MVFRFQFLATASNGQIEEMATTMTQKSFDELVAEASLLGYEIQVISREARK
jgi:hypothetical protein